MAAAVARQPPASQPPKPSAWGAAAWAAPPPAPAGLLAPGGQTQWGAAQWGSAGGRSGSVWGDACSLSPRLSREAGRSVTAPTSEAERRRALALAEQVRRLVRALRAMLTRTLCGRRRRIENWRSGCNDRCACLATPCIAKSAARCLLHTACSAAQPDCVGPEIAGGGGGGHPGDRGRAGAGGVRARRRAAQGRGRRAETPGRPPRQPRAGTRAGGRGDGCSGGDSESRAWVAGLRRA